MRSFDGLTGENRVDQKKEAVWWLDLTAQQAYHCRLYYVMVDSNPVNKLFTCTVSNCTSRVRFSFCRLFWTFGVLRLLRCGILSLPYANLVKDEQH